MNELKKMYHVLEEMLQSAEKNDQERIIELNDYYEDLAQKVHDHIPKRTYSEYDNCRQSCVCSVIHPNMRVNLLSDAKERFSKIAKPK